MAGAQTGMAFFFQFTIRNYSTSLSTKLFMQLVGVNWVSGAGRQE